MCIIVSYIVLSLSITLVTTVHHYQQDIMNIARIFYCLLIICVLMIIIYITVNDVITKSNKLFKVKLRRPYS